MLRFFATLLATGAGVLAATAWWSGDEPVSGPPEPPSSKLERPVDDTDEAATRFVEPSNRKRVEEPQAPTDLAAPAQAPPATLFSDAPVEVADHRPAPIPVMPLVESATESPRTLPPIPAPRIATPPEAPPSPPAYVALPLPAVPAPIPAPTATPPPPPATPEVEETRLPEPAPFTEEIFEIAEADDRGFYGEENVVYIEGDERFDGDDAQESPEVAIDPLEADESRIAMNEGRDASADRIRRLLDVYDSLQRRR